MVAERRTPKRGGILGLLRHLWLDFIGAKVMVKYIFIEAFTKFRSVNIDELPDRNGDVAVITGGNRGISFFIVKKLVQNGFHVIMGVRDIKDGEKTVESIRNLGVTTGSLEVLALDLTSLTSVREFAQGVLQKHSKVHLLLNNAGIMGVAYSITEDNLESQFQVNYLSHFLLTRLLLPTMIKTGAGSDKCCRIVNTSSIAHYGGNINFDDLQGTNCFNSWKAYFDSKLAQVTSTVQLNAQLQDQGARVRIYSLHPGVIPTGLWTSPGPIMTIAHANLLIARRTSEQGGDVVLYAALSPEMEGIGGVYLENSQLHKPNPRVYDRQIQTRLEQVSLQLTGLVNMDMDKTTVNECARPINRNKVGNVKPTDKVFWITDNSN